MPQNKEWAILRRRGSYIVIYDPAYTHRDAVHRTLTETGADDWIRERASNKPFSWKRFAKDAAGALAFLVVFVVLLSLAGGDEECHGGHWQEGEPDPRLAEFVERCDGKWRYGSGR